MLRPRTISAYGVRPAHPLGIEREHDAFGGPRLFIFVADRQNVVDRWRRCPSVDARNGAARAHVVCRVCRMSIACRSGGSSWRIAPELSR
jgi:hypothetical protein